MNKKCDNRATKMESDTTKMEEKKINPKGGKDPLSTEPRKLEEKVTILKPLKKSLAFKAVKQVVKSKAENEDAEYFEDEEYVSMRQAEIRKDEEKEEKKTKKKKEEEKSRTFKMQEHNTSYYVPRGAQGKVIDVRLIDPEDDLFGDPRSGRLMQNVLEDVHTQTIRVFIARARKIQVGDKLAGRHGNKGIISKILSRKDMPYLPDGSPIDVILNPLGVPSRMNVGQVLEGLLGLAGEKLGARFKVVPFDEIYGEEASRILVNQKLKEASLQSNLPWIFNQTSLGKILLRDGRTGDYFDNPITVGKSYILKLIHMVDDKIHARSVGPYNIVTEQPLQGKAHNGGQRFGEMEVWALEAFGCSHILQELLTIKSDDFDSREDIYQAFHFPENVPLARHSISETYLALIRELNALGLNFTAMGAKDLMTLTPHIEEVDFFGQIEIRLKLRSLFEDYRNAHR